MRILILGGTSFLGRHLVDAAEAASHAVTLFNRGQTHPDLFPNVEKLRGNRDGQLDALKGRSWDVAIDTSGYLPRIVRQSAELLKDAVSQYIFVSSISVYQDFDVVGITEDYPVGHVEDQTTEDIQQFYGPLKALCEQEVRGRFGERALIVRPGLIVGPHDPTDRFTYWVRRFSSGGRAIVPGRPEHATQFIDVRDLAEWMIRMAEQRTPGIFNATGFVPPLTMGGLVKALETLPSPANPVWVAEDFLLSHNVEEWTGLPLWIAESTNWPGFDTVDVSAAMGRGLTFRPVEDTIRATWEWDQSRALDQPLKAGLTEEREAALLQEWERVSRA